MKKKPLTVVIEDDLTLAVVRRIIKDSNKFYIHNIYPDITRKTAARGSGYIKARINGFNAAAAIQHYLVITDLDQRECAPSYVSSLLSRTKHPQLFLQIAVHEAEAWLFADKNNFAKYIGISPQKIAKSPEDISDPKEYLFKAVKSSNKSSIKKGILPKDKTAKLGPFYNQLLIDFVNSRWDYNIARQNSDSLNRLVLKLI